MAARIHKNLCPARLTIPQVAQVTMAHIAPPAQALAVLDALVEIVPPVSRIY